MEYLMIIIRTLFFYFFILLIYRIMGKREIGQLGIIDLIVSILIAEFVAISIENYSKSILYSVAPILILVLLEIILSYLSLKIPKIRNILDGNPSLIIKNGKINYKEMLKQKYNLDDLLVQIREKGYRSIEEVEYAILENDGSLSVFNYNNKKISGPLPLPLIVDNCIQKDTLRYLNKDKKWVLELLADRDLTLDNVFYAFYKDKNIFIIKNEDIF